MRLLHARDQLLLVIQQLLDNGQLLIEGRLAVEQLGLELFLLLLKSTTNLIRLAEGIAFRLQLGSQLVLVLEQGGVLGLEGLAGSLFTLRSLNGLLEGLLLVAELLISAGDSQQGLDARKQLPPGPVAQAEIVARVALDNLHGVALVLKVVKVLAGKCTTAK